MLNVDKTEKDYTNGMPMAKKQDYTEEWLRQRLRNGCCSVNSLCSFCNEHQTFDIWFQAFSIKKARHEFKR